MECGLDPEGVEPRERLEKGEGGVGASLGGWLGWKVGTLCGCNWTLKGAKGGWVTEEEEKPVNKALYYEIITASVFRVLTGHQALHTAGKWVLSARAGSPGVQIQGSDT